ncbi:proline-rich extensin-like protein EPR1 [Lolium rigidum]|uniref:proline-rich extensin-like protein EPR1 n=1 Tax=Lolium rigidum TaxID=89674 RepID=UPI001F5DA061|nr:proline-rich extensin-like protein EPR1 [Lolium rigidum]
MVAGGGRLLLTIVICAGLMPAGSEAATSVIIGMAQCASCARKSMNAEAAFKGLKVAIKCNNGSAGAGEYESKAVGDLDGTGAFAVRLPSDVDLRGSAQCFAQLHSAASSEPCPGQEPSKIVPLSDEGNGTFVAIAGKTKRVVSTTPECAAANICFPCHMFGRKPLYMHRHMKPLPDYGMPTPVYAPPVYGTPAPRCLCTPTPEPGCQCPSTTPVYGTPMPEYEPPPTPEFGTPTPDCPPEAPEFGTPTPVYAQPSAPVYGTPAPTCMCSPTPEAGCQCSTATPAPVYGTPAPVYGTPAPRCMCYPTPEAGCQCPTAAPTPVYGTPAPRCLCTPTPEPGCECPSSTPTPVYGTPIAQPAPPTPVYGTPTPRCLCTPTPEPGCQCPSSTPTPVYGTVYGTPTPVYEPPAPDYGAGPTPECPPATPEYGTPIYTPPAHH